MTEKMEIGQPGKKLFKKIANAFLEVFANSSQRLRTAWGTTSF